MGPLSTLLHLNARLLCLAGFKPTRCAWALNHTSYNVLSSLEQSPGATLLVIHKISGLGYFLLCDCSSVDLLGLTFFPQLRAYLCHPPRTTVLRSRLTFRLLLDFGGKGLAFNLILIFVKGESPEGSKLSILLYFYK